MPTYDYSCKVCGHEFEEFQSITEEPFAECPECHVTTKNRLVSAVAIVLKGEGWAADGYTKSKNS